MYLLRPSPRNRHRRFRCTSQAVTSESSACGSRLAAYRFLVTLASEQR